MVEGDGHVMLASGGLAPWLIVAGGFHSRGGMDKANAALASYLLGRGHTVHLVAHEIDNALTSHPHAVTHLVERPRGSVLLGESRLARVAARLLGRLRQRDPRTRVVANGGNFISTDINWVHAVHHAWPPVDAGAPAWFRAKNRLWHARARRRERRAISQARLVIANSERTRRDLVELAGVEAARVRVVYLAGGAGPVSPGERAEARRWLGVDDSRPLVAFVGALGHDHNKGFDTLWRCWQSLGERTRWDAELVVAGGGRGLELWRGRTASAGLSGRIRFLGFSDRLDEVLAACDLLVSPVRYEAYGLNVHEAVSRGVPALVSRRAGVAERFPADLSEMLLHDPEDADALAARLLLWRNSIQSWKERFEPFADSLRRRTWADVAAEIVAIVEGMPARAVSAA
jgi:glycosyltransferase involved in cell wall biosynthesis